jgi:hypothetical protein
MRVAEEGKSNLEGPQLHIRNLTFSLHFGNGYVCPQFCESADLNSIFRPLIKMEIKRGIGNDCFLTLIVPGNVKVDLPISKSNSASCCPKIIQRALVQTAANKKHWCRLLMKQQDKEGTAEDC